MSNLTNEAASTSMWALMEKIGLMGIQFIISMVLARLLSPDDYGVIAMLLIFISIAQNFIDSGFGSALVRKQNCTEADYSTAFIFNVFVGIICYLLLFLSAPLVSDFYHLDLLTPVLRWYGLVLIINSLFIVQNAILTQRLAFKVKAKSSIISNATSGLFALFLAYYGFGVWALVAQTLISAITNLVILTSYAKWKPVLMFSVESFRYLWNFGSKLLASALISTLYGNMYSIIIGKFYTKADLGFYNRGSQTSRLLPDIVSDMFGKSSFPLLSKVQNDRDALINTFRRFTQISAFLSFPLIFLMVVIAKPFILFLLTDKWIESVPYIWIFSIAILTTPIGRINLNLILALGRSDLMLKADIIKKSVGISTICLLLYLGVFKSPQGLAIVSMILELFIYSVNLYYAKEVLKISYMVQIKDFMPYLLASFVMAIVTYFAICYIESNLLQLIIGPIVAFAVYYLLTYYIIKTPFYKQIMGLIKQKFNH